MGRDIGGRLEPSWKQYNLNELAELVIDEYFGPTPLFTVSEVYEHVITHYLYGIYQPVENYYLQCIEFDHDILVSRILSYSPHILPGRG